MRALVNKASRFASTPERGQIVGGLGGLAVFFDDYSNAMIVGPTMRPMTDRLKVSREKLAYIVDSTAAPVASLMIGTWFGAEISYIQSGLDMVRDSGTAPAFLLDTNGQLVSGMRAYFLSWPHRFYPILAIVMVFLIAWRGRDFGPMLTAERKARAGAPPNAPLKTTAFDANSAEVEGRAWYAVVPMLVLVGVSLALLVILGWGGSDAAAWASAGWADRVRIITDNTDSYASILYAALASLVVAGAIAALTRAIPLHAIHDAMMNGMTRIFPALVILALAWSLAAGMDDLQLAQVAETFLKEQQFHVQLLPLLVFLISAGVSFATGSSWSTMIIICPIVVKVGAGLADGLEPEFARRIFYSAVGSVLAGSIFGDHCSPISDTTVLSSMGSDCDHVAHVWTQMPYAVAVAIVGALCGDLLCTEMNWNPLIGIGLSIVVLLVLLQFVGRRVDRQTAT
jgi:Na+/H+ antiporter NhaC